VPDDHKSANTMICENAHPKNSGRRNSRMCAETRSRRGSMSFGGASVTSAREESAVTRLSMYVGPAATAACG
jgi:hypothetical protein